jgi:hypothetical protein
MWHACPHDRAQRLTAVVAALFGVATLVAGGRLLLGLGEAGYEVVRPVLLFNTGMGVLYLAAAALILRDVERGRLLAGGIAAVNVVVLLAVVVRRATGGPVADETLAAMALRAGVWIAITVALRRASADGGGRRAPLPVGGAPATPGSHAPGEPAARRGGRAQLR